MLIINKIHMPLLSVLILIFGQVAFHMSGAEKYYNFKKTTTDHGLSQNTIHTIYQDTQGFIWIGTFDGLNQYNGYDFTIYRHQADDAHSISGNNISCIYEDSQGILWIGTFGAGLNRFDRQSNSFYHYKHEVQNRQTINNNTVLSIIEDRQNRLWIGTETGLNYFDRGKKVFIRYEHTPVYEYSIGPGRVWTLYEDSQENLWIGLIDGGLDRFDREKQRFYHYHPDPLDQNSLSSDTILSLFEDSQQRFWVGTRQGLNLFDRKKQTFTCYQHDPGDQNSISHNLIRKICEDSHQKLWIATADGLNQFEPDKKIFNVYKNNHTDPFSLNADFIWTLYYDRTGMLWVGTGCGIARLNTNNAIELLRSNPASSNSLSSNYIRSIYEDRQEILWIGTQNQGLNRFDRRTQTYTHYFHDPKNAQSISSNQIYSICEDKQGRLWIGTFDKGLNLFNQKKQTFTRFRHDPNNPDSISSDWITSLHLDEDGVLWVGTDNAGLNKLDARENKFIRYSKNPGQPYALSNINVQAICDAEKDCLWIGTENGLNHLNKKTGSITHYFHNPYQLNSLSHNSICSLLKDRSGDLWIGTIGGGLNRFDPDKALFTHFRLTEGLPNNYIYGILEDDQNQIWMSTNKGVACLNPLFFDVRSFSLFDNLQSDEFSFNAYCKSKTGELLFGGVNGFNIIQPAQMRQNEYPPSVVLSLVTQGGEKMMPAKSREKMTTIDLDWKKNFFDFELAVLNFLHAEKNQYAYRLEGFEKEWHYLGNKRWGGYTNLPGGYYVLKIKGANNDRIWSEEKDAIGIKVKYPPWKTGWANLIYITIFGLIMAAIYFYSQEKEKNLFLNRMNQERITFFVNLSHEVKTPLTLITNYLRKYIHGPRLESDLKIVQQYVEKLQYEINNYLFLEKIQQARQEDHYQSIVNLSDFIRKKIDHYQESARQKGIKIKTEIRGAIFIRAESLALEWMFNNLFDNAVKYVDENGTIEAHLELTQFSRPQKGGQSVQPERVTFSIQNSGAGLSRDQQKNIFTPYYQLDDTQVNKQGIGMGLLIVKKMAELLQGSITVESEINQITRFSLHLPVYTLKEGDTVVCASSISRPADWTGSQQKQLKTNPHCNEKLTLLIVEDNIDMACFLQNHFLSRFNVYTAANGRQALNQLNQIPLPDMILSDMTMQEMNGLQFYEALSEHNRYKHIPFIFLTARNDLELKIETLRKGALDYIVKPFFIEELEARINTLLLNKTRQIDQLTEQVKSFLQQTPLQKDSFTHNFQAICLKAGITEREKQVITALLDGLEYKEMTNTLFISQNTINSHVKSIYKKLNINSKGELFKKFYGHF